MKKELLMVIAAYFVLSFTAITGVYAIEEKAKIVTISKYETDITGDGLNEVVLLKGFPYQADDSYLRKIEIDVSASDNKQYHIPLESGSKASLNLVDLNNDGVRDVFASVHTGGSGGITINYLYSLKDFQFTNLSVPDPLEIESHFMNGYKANVKIADTGKNYFFDLKDRKKYYKKLGLYHNGKLNEPTELTVNPYSSLKPIQINGEKLGLKGIQRITGIANADTIAFVETFWSFVDGKWKLVNTLVTSNSGK